MLGPHALRGTLKQLRAAALTAPHHVDDVRYLLSMRRPNDFQDYSGDGGGDANGNTSTEYPDDTVAGPSSSSSSSSAVAVGPSSRMPINAHAVYLKSCSDVMTMVREARGTEVVHDNADDASGQLVTSSANPQLAQQYFWLSKRLSALPTAVGGHHGRADGDDEDAQTAPTTKRRRQGKAMPLSAAASGIHTDISSLTRVEAFPLAEAFLGPQYAATWVSQTTSTPSTGEDEEFASSAATEKVNPYDYVADTLSEQAVVTCDEFLFVANAALLEPFYKPPTTVDLSLVATEDEPDITETTLPRYELSMSFVMTGRHTRGTRVALVNTHFFTLEMPRGGGGGGVDNAALGAVGTTTTITTSTTTTNALVEHVGLMDVKSLIDLPELRRKDLNSSSSAANALSNTQRHTVTIRLNTATDAHCVGALKGRVFYKVGDADGSLEDAPIRCLEFGPIALR